MNNQRTKNQETTTTTLLIYGKYIFENYLNQKCINNI